MTAVFIALVSWALGAMLLGAMVIIPILLSVGGYLNS
jgi:hypothetical protein